MSKVQQKNSSDIESSRLSVQMKKFADRDEVIQNKCITKRSLLLKDPLFKFQQPYYIKKIALDQIRVALLAKAHVATFTGQNSVHNCRRRSEFKATS